MLSLGTIVSILKQGQDKPHHFGDSSAPPLQSGVIMDIPRDKNYPADAAQCDGCGGHGCEICGHKGWLPAGHPKARKCYRDECANFIPPAQVAVYCSNECAFKDA